MQWPQSCNGYRYVLLQPCRIGVQLFKLGVESVFLRIESLLLGVDYAVLCRLLVEVVEHAIGKYVLDAQLNFKDIFSCSFLSCTRNTRIHTSASAIPQSSEQYLDPFRENFVQSGP